MEAGSRTASIREQRGGYQHASCRCEGGSRRRLDRRAMKAFHPTETRQGSCFDSQAPAPRPLLAALPLLRPVTGGGSSSATPPAARHSRAAALLVVFTAAIVRALAGAKAACRFGALYSTPVGWSLVSPQLRPRGACVMIALEPRASRSPGRPPGARVRDRPARRRPRACRPRPSPPAPATARPPRSPVGPASVTGRWERGLCQRLCPHRPAARRARARVRGARPGRSPPIAENLRRPARP